MNVKKSLPTVTAALICLLGSCVGTGSSSAASGQSSPAGESARKDAPLIESVSPLYGAVVSQGSTQEITYRLKDKAVADSVVLSVGNRRVGTVDTSGYAYAIGKAHPTGRVVYRVTAYSGGRSDSRTGEFAVMAATPPTLYGHTVRKAYPHGRDAYTQGLLWHDGHLYESTGLEGRSSLRKVELETGRPVRTELLDGKLFGEGLALLGGKLYQLTWQNNKALVYDLETFAKTGEFDYGGEGWGLTTDGTYLYQSDGSERIYVLDPATFRRIRTIEVCTDQSKVPYINELEWIKGEIWANVYTTDTIVRIDPETGAVTGVIDMSGLLAPEDVTESTDVLNGIAYDAKADRIFVTGKNWSKLFDITVHKK